MLINNEDFEIVDEFLVRWKFDFWVMKLLKCLILVGFDDIRYDKGLILSEWQIYIIFMGFLMIKRR